MMVFTTAFVGPWAGDYCEEDAGVSVHATAVEAVDYAIKRWTAHHDASLDDLRVDCSPAPVALLDIKDRVIADLDAGKTICIWSRKEGPKDAFQLDAHDLSP